MRDEDLEEDSDWSEDDYGDDDDSPEYIPCPNCRAEIYEDAVRCPNCGEYIARHTSAWSGRPTWYVLLGLAGIIAVIAGILWLF